jgi:acetoin utilization deacetylase AcuC-like enzyme
MALERLAIPAIRAHRPDLIIIACGYDAAAFDPLGRMLCTAETFRAMTRGVLDLANEVADGRLAMVHEGGYSETYVPFCGHAVLAEMAGSDIDAPDPFAQTLSKRQPGPAFDAFAENEIDTMRAAMG